MAEKKVNIEELIQDDHNFNRGTERGQELIKKSFNELGAGRSILLDKDNRIIAGNKSQLAAIDAGIKKVRIIETDGKELIAVKRTDVTLDSKKGRELALADNATTQASLEWDDDELQAAKEEFNVTPSDWGVLGFDDWNNLDEVNGDTGDPSFGNGKNISIKIPVEEQDHREEILNVVKEAVAGYNVKVV